MRAALVRQLEPLDALLMPVAGIAAFRHRERQWPIAGQQIGLFQAMMPAVVANVLGLPAVTIPMTISSQGLPGSATDGPAVRRRAPAGCGRASGRGAGLRSAKAPAISAGVMTANFIWKAM